MKKTGIKTNKTSYGNGAGFTLVELMVAVAIMILISAVVFANYRPANQQLALQRSAHKLAQDIRIAQEMAMSSAEVGGLIPPVPEGFGVAIDRVADIYRIYADVDGNQEFNGGDIVIGNNPIFLESGVIIHRIYIESVSANCNEGIINFMPPDPLVNITSKSPDRTGELWIRIILALESDPNQTRTVRVNNAGLIYVE